MKKLFKNVAYIFGVLVITSGIFFFVSNDQELKGDVFNHSLDLLGKQLLEVLPNSNEREVIQARWQNFSERARNGHVAPDKVERVAIAILNARNMEEQLSLEEAEVIIDLAKADIYGFPRMSELAEIEVDFQRQGEVQAIKPLKPKLDSSEDFTSEKTFAIKFDELGENLLNICRFNNNIHEFFAGGPEKRDIFVKNFRYEIDDGIKLNADIKIKKKLDGHEWFQEMSHFGHEEFIKWRHDFATELEDERHRISIHLDSLKTKIEFRKMRNDSLVHGIVTVELNEKLKALKILEKLQHWRAFDYEMIEQIIEESTKDLKTEP